MAAPTTEGTTTVLLVDDENSTRFLLAAMLKSAGYRVMQADSAANGRALIEEHGTKHFDLIISDYWMPGENGIEFLKTVRHSDACLAVILMTADGERQVLEKLVNFGGCGFLQKPFSHQDLASKVEQAVQQTKKKRRLKATEIEANKLGENQRLLLKQHLEIAWPGVEFSFSSKSQASGDFVSATDMPDSSKILLFSDASGHELSSAFQSNYFHGLARGMLVKDARIADVFNFFNKTLIDEWNDDGLVSHSLAACALRFSPKKQRITFINAGFPQPMIAGLDGFATPLGSDRGAPPLGWFEDPYSVEETHLRYGTLTAWSDGLEDLAAELQLDGLALADRLMNNEQDNTSLLANAQDDIAVIRVTTPGTPKEAEPKIAILSQKYSGSSIDDIDTIQTLCENSIRYAIPNIEAERLSEILVCLREALINALKHGCESRPDKFATVQIARTKDRSRISIQIQDEGSGHSFDWESHAEEAADQLLTEHRGLIMIQAIPDRTHVNLRGSQVIMEFDQTHSQN